jgi:hypothetical protein
LFAPMQRLRDTIRSMYLVANDVGSRQAACANLTFSPDLSGFLPTDFMRAPAIVEEAGRRLGPFMSDLNDALRAFQRGNGRR